jgi:hypothetical protein
MVEEHGEKRPGWNIYTPGKTVRETSERFSFIHHTLKYKLFIPVLFVFERLVGRKLDKEVPSESYNRTLQIFNDSFERAIVDWGWLYLRNIDTSRGDISSQKPREWWEKSWPLEASPRLLRAAKDSALTVALNDTAYREFLNIWCHTLAQGMLKEYAGQSVKHVFYTADSVYDVHYYYAWTIVSGETTEIRLEEVSS